MQVWISVAKYGRLGATFPTLTGAHNMSLRQSFRKPPGLLGWVVVAVKVAEWIIDWAVRKDYVGEQFKKIFPSNTWPVWWARMVDFLGHPLVQLLILIVGLVLIAFGSRSDRPSGVPSDGVEPPLPTPLRPTSSTMADLGRMGAEIKFPAPQRDERTERIRTLLREAAQMVREQQGRVRDKPSTDDAIRDAWTIHATIPAFLHAAFVLPKWKENYEGFVKLEREKRGHQAVPESAAKFLERMAEGVTPGDVDESFVLPNSFRQYRETENWPGHSS